MRLVVQVHVEPHPLGRIASLQRFFRGEIRDAPNVPVEESVQRPLADPLSLHEELEHVVVREGQVFPRLELFQHILSLNYSTKSKNTFVFC